MSIDDIVATLQHNNHDFCIVDNFSTAHQLKQRFNNTQQLPPIVVLSQLLIAFQQLGDSSIKQCLAVSALGILASNKNPKNRLIWIIYQYLQQVSKVSNTIVLQQRVALAEQLADLFIAIDENSLQEYKTSDTAHFSSPFSDCKNDFEVNLANALWTILAEEGEVLCKQKALQQLSKALNDNNIVAAVVYSDSASVIEEAFFKSLQVKTITILKSNLPQAIDSTDLFYQEGKGDTLTNTAQKSLQAIYIFLNDKSEYDKMGIVVYDRLLARRLRAMAENQGILIQDTIGWRAETLAYGSALLLFLKMAIEPFSVSNITIYLQSPFFAGDIGLVRAEKEWRYDLVHSVNTPTGYDFLINQQWKSQTLNEKFRYFNDCNQNNFNDTATLKQWLDWLFLSSAPMLNAWQNDGLAQKLKQKIYNGVNDIKIAMTAVEFHHYMKHFLAHETIVDREIDSPIVFVSPNNKRTFHTLMLLGCVDDNNNNNASQWLSESERQSLGLQSWGDAKKATHDYLAHCFASHTRLCYIWLGQNAVGENNRVHPLWADFSEIAKNNGQHVTLPDDNDDAMDVKSPPSEATNKTRTKAEGRVNYLPATLPLSSATDLMKCPYRFYVNQYLNLSCLETGNAATLSPAMLGKIMHVILEKFLIESKAIFDKEQLKTLWQKIVSEKMVGNHPILNLYATYWRANGEQFIEWEHKRREEGSSTQKTEYPITFTWQARQSQTIFKARLDRLDYNDSTGNTIIDYKSSLSFTLEALENGEFPQLSLYDFFLGLDNVVKNNEKIVVMPFKDKIVTVDKSSTQRVVARLRQVLYAIEAGHAMPANGINDNCRQCSAIGICRKKQ